jgi:hypothetical protein
MGVPVGPVDGVADGRTVGVGWAVTDRWGVGDAVIIMPPPEPPPEQPSVTTANIAAAATVISVLTNQARASKWPKVALSIRRISMRRLRKNDSKRENGDTDYLFPAGKALL